MSETPLLLLDTHIWIWWIEQDRRLPEPIRCAIERSTTSILISAVSVYELAVLVYRSRIRLTQDVEYWVQQATDGADISVISVDREIARIAGLLPVIHGDPLDRLLIATACCLDAQVASLDEKFRAYPQLTGRLVG